MVTEAITDLDPEVVQDGEEFVLELAARWSRLQPMRGEVLEIHMASSDYIPVYMQWAGFLVMETVQDDLGAITCRVKFLGSPDSTLSKELSNRFNRRTGWVHLCRTRPCLQHSPDYAIHVTRARWWSLAGFATDYMTSAVRRQIAKWLKPEKEKDPDIPTLPPATFGAMPKSGARAFGGSPDKVPDDDYCPSDLEEQPDGLPFGDLPPAGAEPTSGPADKEAQRRMLRARLRGVREKFVPGSGDQPSKTIAQPAVLGAGKEGNAAASKRQVAMKPMHTASTLHPPELGQTPLLQEGIRGDIMKYSRGPAKDLLAQALSNMKQQVMRKKKEKKRKDKKDRLLSAFREAFGAKKKKKKKKKKDKGQDGRDPDGDGSPTSSSSSEETKSRKRKRKKVMIQADGTQISLSDSCTSASDEDQSSESTDLEAPLRKRSQKRPGSVLALLVNHVKSQLNQGSLLDLDPQADSVTQGVKITTYFSLHLRPQFSGATREMREMYGLARMLDTIRSGDVATATDQMAARFIALHQALLDGSWSTAKHMELCPLEDCNAATPSMVLATRRHSKLYQKMQGFEAGGNFGAGRGKGKRGWSSWGYEGDRNDSGQKGKGKPQKGKGKNQDGRYKGKGQANQNNPWAQSLEKAEEKPPQK